MRAILSAKAEPAAFGKVGVLLGGRSAEREVSLMSRQWRITSFAQQRH